MSKRGKGFFGYFNTPAGRRLVFSGSCVLGISFFAGNFLPHTIFLKNYKEFVQCYRNGLERTVPEKLSSRVEKAFDILNVSEFERKLIKPFIVYGFDTFQAGSTKYRFGGVLGLPWNYTYETRLDVNHQDVRFRHEMIQWSSEAGKLLEEALVLNEKEQIFAICKSILQLKTQSVLLNSLYPVASFLFVYSMGNALNQKLNLYARPLSLRIVMYSILGLFGIGTWSFAKDFTQVYYDAEIDKRLCDLGPEYIEAGMKFYDKILKKNKALRELRGDDFYTAGGNENYFLRQKSLPLTIRKSYFEMRLGELKKHLDENNKQVPA